MEVGDVTGRRIAAALIDIGIVLVLLFVVAGVFGNSTAQDASISAEVRGKPALLFLVLTFAYFFGTEKVWAQTFGKRVMKLRVVDSSGAALTTRASLIRNVVRLVDWLPFFYLVGVITMFATGNRRLRVGDLAAGTRVVAADAAAPGPPPPRPDDEDVIASVLR